MADQTLLAKARKARFDDLPNFSGHPLEDAERFLKSIKNITKATDESDNRELLEIVRGKLTQAAGIWFDNNEHSFNKWSDFATAFRNRYFSSTMVHTKFDALKQRKQSHDEAVTSYFDDVVNLCREIDSNMSEKVIIQHLMSGLNPDFRKELSRRESSMNTLNEFLKYAKVEQDLHDTFEKTRQVSLESEQLYYTHNHSSIPTFTATINQQEQHHQVMKPNTRFPHRTSTQRSVLQRNSIRQFGPRSTTIPDKRISDDSQQPTFKGNQMNHQSTLHNRFQNCKICGRGNHRTIDCFHKRPTGCFNCGQDHIVRDCKMPPNFQ